MDPDQEAKRLKSIRYILRRRKRSQRVGANSGGAVKSVQQKMRGHLVFTPSGSAGAWWQRLVWLIAWPLALFIVFFPAYMIALFLDAPRTHMAGFPPHAWVIFGLLGTVSAGVVAFTAAFTLLSLWRALRRLSGYKKE